MADEELPIAPEEVYPAWLNDPRGENGAGRNLAKVSDFRSEIR